MACRRPSETATAAGGAPPPVPPGFRPCGRGRRRRPSPPQAQKHPCITLQPVASSGRPSRGGEPAPALSRGRGPEGPPAAVRHHRWTGRSPGDPGALRHSGSRRRSIHHTPAGGRPGDDGGRRRGRGGGNRKEREERKERPLVSGTTRQHPFAPFAVDIRVSALAGGGILSAGLQAEAVARWAWASSELRDASACTAFPGVHNQFQAGLGKHAAQKIPDLCE